MSSSPSPSRPATANANRKRASSITQALNAIPLNQPNEGALGLTPSPAPALQLNGSETSFIADQDAQAQLRQRKKASGSEKGGDVRDESSEKDKKKKKRGFIASAGDQDRYTSFGFWDDLKTGKWMLIPSESFCYSLPYRPPSLRPPLPTTTGTSSTAIPGN